MPSPNKRTTLKDIALEAKLSVAAVSMALKNNPDMAAATVKRVKALAEKMGYKPDPALSALSAYRSRKRVQSNFSVIGLVTSWRTKNGWTKLASAKEVIRGVEERADQLGYSVQVFWAREPGVSAARFSDILHARGIRGLVLGPFEDNDAALDLDWKRFSVVTISRPSRYTRFHHVVQNHYMDLLNCWERTWNLGYRRIGLVVQEDIASRWSHQWEAAYGLCANREGGKSLGIPILRVEDSQDVESIRGWARQYRPEAVISRCDTFLEAMEAEGLRVPEDIGYVSLNVNEDVQGVAGVMHRRDMIGSMAIDVLNSQLQRNFKGPQDVSLGTQIDGIWQDGGSLPRAGKP